jgi:hypothetical protein
MGLSTCRPSHEAVRPVIRQTALARLCLLALFLGVPAGVNAQERGVTISRLSHDSIGLMLGRSGYVVVVEKLPHRVPRIVYPTDEDEWTQAPAGAVTLPGPLRVLSGSTGPEPSAPQCIVRPGLKVRVWDGHPIPGLSQIACGPLFTSGLDPNIALGSGHGPWSAWAVPVYDPGQDDRSYVVVAVLDPTDPPLSLGPPVLGWTRSMAPYTLAQGLGGLSRALRDPEAWSAAIYIVRRGKTP